MRKIARRGTFRWPSAVFVAARVSPVDLAQVSTRRRDPGGAHCSFNSLAIHSLVHPEQAVPLLFHPTGSELLMNARTSMSVPPKKYPSPPAAGRRLLPKGLTRLMVTRCTTPAGQGKFQIGRLHAGPLVLPCALGASGLKRTKREGDRATPIGTFPLLFGYYRPDRLRRWRTSFSFTPLRPGLGWCDDIASSAYNRLVSVPCSWSHERLWRDDHLYDVVIVLDYNYRRRRAGYGSAIFLHCARPDLAPTEGCIALRAKDLRRLLPRLAPRVVVTVR